MYSTSLGCQHFCRKLRSLVLCRELLIFSNEKRRNSKKFEEKFVGDLNAAGNNVVKKNIIATCAPCILNQRIIASQSKPFTTRKISKTSPLHTDQLYYQTCSHPNFYWTGTIRNYRVFCRYLGSYLCSTVKNQVVKSYTATCTFSTMIVINI